MLNLLGAVSVKGTLYLENQGLHEQLFQLLLNHNVIIGILEIYFGNPCCTLQRRIVKNLSQLREYEEKDEIVFASTSVELHKEWVSENSEAKKLSHYCPLPSKQE
jgi:hypothetical protein